MGIHQAQKELFVFSVGLDRRVRPDPPLRRVRSAVDLSLIRAEVALAYGANGNASVDPVVLVTDRMHRTSERGFTTNDSNGTKAGRAGATVSVSHF